jgi:hypothetical protein
VVADRRHEQVEQRSFGRRLDRWPEDHELDLARVGQLRPEALDEHGAHRRLRRAGQDTAIDFDHGIARDDVVLDACVDDVRTHGVAQERPQRPGVHRVAGHREGRLGRVWIVAGEGVQDRAGI